MYCCFVNSKLFRLNNSAECVGERTRALPPTSRVALKDSMGGANSGENSLHWMANMLPLSSIYYDWCSARRRRERMGVLNTHWYSGTEPDAGLSSLPTALDYMSSFLTEINIFASLNIDCINQIYYFQLSINAI